MTGPSNATNKGSASRGSKRKLSEAKTTPTRQNKKQKQKPTSGQAKTVAVQNVEGIPHVRSQEGETISGKQAEVAADTAGMMEDVGDETVEVEEQPVPPPAPEQIDNPVSTPLPTEIAATTIQTPLPAGPAPPLFTTHKYHRLAPPKPSSSTLPLPHASTTSRPRGASTTNPTREIKRRDVIYVTKNTGLGSYLRRCKKLLVEEGHAQITLHALSAAIPHALLVLHSLLDILPFPKKHVSHELKSSSVKCFDELKSTGGRKRKAGGDEGEIVGDADGAGTGGDEWEPVLFDEEEPEGAVRVRIKSAIEIIIRVGPAHARSTVAPQDRQKQKQKEVEVLDAVRNEPAPKKVDFVGANGNGKGDKDTAGTAGSTALLPAAPDVPAAGAPAVTDGATPLTTEKGKKKNRPSKAKRMARRKVILAEKEAELGKQAAAEGQKAEEGDEEEMMNMT
ncbi:hypothetical protein FFLO_01458 [Filobasidium floriforme]|uniref:Uncharacterized protein n=1 Tax=Filobasidium floriforme TaxID=5210 RepID=A0A8K0NSU9_9TREE|nr:hypothetical protein FFLO_01458 [Filobasidium floriforme]